MSKMSRFRGRGCGSRDVQWILRDRHKMPRCQDVKMSKMSKMSGVGPVTREMSGGFCVMFVRCQDV